MSTRRPPLCVLTIAGSDSGGGAGLQADARTIHALGAFACTAVTAVTAQNTRGVVTWQPVSPRLLTAQILAVTGERPGLRRHGKSDSRRALESGTLPIRAIKIGLLPGAAAVQAVVRALERTPAVPVVVDPVIGSTSGTQFLGPAGIRALRESLLPLATLITPNWPETERLTGKTLRSYAEVEPAARALIAGTGCAVLVKGGHAPGRECRDCLVTPDGKVRWFGSARVASPNTHGTGCVLSAAIATELARGATLVDAVSRARRFLQRSLRRHRHVRWSGAGPAYPGT